MSDHPRTEIVLPGTTTDDLHLWAANIEAANPISRATEAEDVGLDLLITDMGFMSVEISFLRDGEYVHTLALFATEPTAAELLESMRNH